MGGWRMCKNFAGSKIPLHPGNNHGVWWTWRQRQNMWNIDSKPQTSFLLPWFMVNGPSSVEPGCVDTVIIQLSWDHKTTAFNCPYLAPDSLPSISEIESIFNPGALAWCSWPLLMSWLQITEKPRNSKIMS